MPFYNRFIKSAGWSLVEQIFHFSDGTFFRISTTRCWIKIPNSLLYDLIRAKETFELDHAYKLEKSISPLSEFKTVRLKQDKSKLPRNSSLGTVTLFLYGVTLDSEATSEVETKFFCDPFQIEATPISLLGSIRKSIQFIRNYIITRHNVIKVTSGNLSSG